MACMTLNSSSVFCYSVGRSGSSSSRFAKMPSEISFFTVFLFFLVLFFLDVSMWLNQANQYNQTKSINSNYMKSTVSKSQIAPKPKTNSQQKNDLSTGNTSRQRSHVQSFNRPRDHKTATQPMLKDKIQNKLISTQIVKAQQLFGIIDTFYSTLCDLPLQKLVSSCEPLNWISQQQDTLKQLEKKLSKVSSHKDYQYFKWKLHSLQNILSNINENMNMLNRIKHLKKYASGTDSSNYRSRGSSSCESENRQIKLGDFASSDHSQIQEMLSYDQYAITTLNNDSQGAQTAEMKRSPQLVAQTINSDQELDSEEQTMAKSQIIRKQCKRGRAIPKQGQNRNISNVMKMMKKQTKTTHMIEQDLKDKTLAKNQKNKNCSSQRTLSNAAGEGGRFLQDRLLNENQQDTKRNEKHIIKTVQNSKSVQIQGCQDRHSHQQSPSTNKNQHYIELIKELKLQLISKDAQIQKLLINEQSYDQTIQLFRMKEKEKNTEILFLKQNLSNGYAEKQKILQQIKKMQMHSQQLKETIKFERDRNRKQENAKQKVEQKYYQQINQKQLLLDEIKRLTEDNKLCKKSERIMKEKLQIYTKKYYNLYNELELEKQGSKMLMKQLQNMKNYRSKTLSRYEQIKQIVQFHKDKLCQSEDY